MWDLFLHPANFAFSIALCLMLLIGMLEAILLSIGGGSHGFLEQFLPNSSLEHAQPEVGVDSPQSIFLQTFDWLGVGRLPLLIWLVVFLTSFAVCGYMLQGIFHFIAQNFLSAWLAIPISLIISAPILHWVSRLLVKVIPRDETAAIHSDELIGRTATIILGDAKPNSPAQARVKDQHGHTHYVLVEPETDDIYKQGQDVVLTQKTSIGFHAIVLNK